MMTPGGHQGALPDNRPLAEQGVGEGGDLHWGANWKKEAQPNHLNFQIGKKQGPGEEKGLTHLQDGRRWA